MAEFEGIEAVVNQATIKVTTAVMMAIKDADVGPQPATKASPREPQRERERHGTPALGKSSFNWNAQDWNTELLNFEMEVTNMLETKTSELIDEEKALVIKNWLGREGLQLTNGEKEKCITAKGLFSVLSHTFKLHHNIIVLSQQYLKLKRKSHKSGQEWMGRL